ncbi:MAG: tetratricopeptide repeat protein [Candidatus Roizmanbacteria bacterium]|nr:MAG: tetratricopeptide repeat protein [Candidatus Roizmanbacteria bacterium]
MALTHFQKKFIKNNVRKLPLIKIADHLKISEDDILTYLKGQWREDKYKKFIKSLNDSAQSSDSDGNNSYSNGWLSKNLNWIMFPLLILLVLIVYINSLNNVFLSDDFGILQNRNLGTLKDIISQPFTSVRPFFYLIAFKLGGFNPAFYRSINILLHIGSVYLLYIILRKITKKQVAIFASTIFTVHPIFTEAVTWVSGGGYAQYSFFFLLSLYTYIGSNQKVKHYILSVVFFILSMLSSITAVSLSAVYFVYELSFGNLRKNWVKVVPFFLISMIFAFVALKGLGPRLETQRTIYYQEVQKIQNPLTQVPTAISSYLELIFWPDKLTLYHSELIFTMYEFGLRVIITVLLLGIIAYSFFKNKFIFFWLSLFVISLLLTLMPFGVSWVVAERYVYLGAVGIIVSFSYMLYFFYKKSEVGKQIISLLVVFIVIALGARTIYRNIDWANEDNLWIATGKTSPSSPNNHNNLGDVYFRRKDYKRAILEFQTAVRLKPNYGDAYHNMANTYYQIGNQDEALKNYQTALKFNPAIWQSYQNIAIIYFGQGNYLKAAEYQTKSIQFAPPNSSLYANLGVIYLKLNNKNKAKEAFQKALTLEPDNQKLKEMISSL